MSSITIYNCPTHGPVLDVIPISLVVGTLKSVLYQLYQCGRCGRWVTWRQRSDTPGESVRGGCDMKRREKQRLAAFN